MRHRSRTAGFRCESCARWWAGRTPRRPGPGAIRALAIPRIAEPEEITRLVLFVASDQASFSTASEFIADGKD